jgi:hypothetical protein
MAELKDVMGYICQKYPYKYELSKSRLAKLVYLADWKSCLEDDHQITPLRWKFNHYGPYVDDVINTARASDDFDVVYEANVYGEPKEVVRLARMGRWPTLNEQDKDVLDHVINETQSLGWNEFIKLVYSTFPVIVSDRHQFMDLVSLARRYRREMGPEEARV